MNIKILRVKADCELFVLKDVIYMLILLFLLYLEESAWIYEWPNNQESNLLAANEAYQQAFKLPIVDKKPQSFKLLMKKNHAACIMTLGYTQLEICKEKVCSK